jgi:hypothetical protein
LGAAARLRSVKDCHLPPGWAMISDGSDACRPVGVLAWTADRQSASNFLQLARPDAACVFKASFWRQQSEK